MSLPRGLARYLESGPADSLERPCAECGFYDCECDLAAERDDQAEEDAVLPWEADWTPEDALCPDWLEGFDRIEHECGLAIDTLAFLEADGDDWAAPDFEVAALHFEMRATRALSSAVAL